MTEILETNEETQVVDSKPTVVVTADGNAVNITLNKGITAWEAIGLLETALILIKQQYSSSNVESTS